MQSSRCSLKLRLGRGTWVSSCHVKGQMMLSRDMAGYKAVRLLTRHGLGEAGGKIGRAAERCLQVRVSAHVPAGGAEVAATEMGMAWKTHEEEESSLMA